MNLKREQAMYAILLTAGIAVLIGGLALVKIAGIDNLIGGISGLGGAWIGISGIKLYQIKNNTKRYQAQIIGQNDERNIAIRGYAGYSTFITTLLGIGFMTYLFIFLDYTVPFIIGALLLLIHTVSFLLFARHYGKKV